MVITSPSPRAGDDSFDNVVIAGAAADAAFECIATRACIRMSPAAQYIARDASRASAAVPALMSVLAQNRRGHRVVRWVAPRAATPWEAGRVSALKGEWVARLAP